MLSAYSCALLLCTQLVGGSSHTLIETEKCERTRQREIADAIPIQMRTGRERVVVLVHPSLNTHQRRRSKRLAKVIEAADGWFAISGGTMMLKEIDRRLRKRVLSHNPMGAQFYVDACIIEHMRPSQAIQAITWCKQSGALVLADSQMSAYIDVWPGGSMDVFLTQSDARTQELGEHQAATLYHEHTNPGVVSTQTTGIMPVRVTMALQGSDDPSHALLQAFGDSLCQAAARSRQDEWGLHFEAVRLGPRPSIVFTHACGMPTSTAAASSMTAATEIHESNHITQADIALVWPQNATSRSYNRSLNIPGTQLLFWMSHGTPSIAFATPAHSELARCGYELDTSESSVLVTDLAGVERVAHALISNTSARLKLRRQGLAIAALYTTTAVAHRLMRVIERFLSSKQPPHEAQSDAARSPVATQGTSSWTPSSNSSWFCPNNNAAATAAWLKRRHTLDYRKDNGECISQLNPETRVKDILNEEGYSRTWYCDKLRSDLSPWWTKPSRYTKITPPSSLSRCATVPLCHM